MTSRRGNHRASAIDEDENTSAPALAVAVLRAARLRVHAAEARRIVTRRDGARYQYGGGGGGKSPWTIASRAVGDGAENVEEEAGMDGIETARRNCPVGGATACRRSGGTNIATKLMRDGQAKHATPAERRCTMAPTKDQRNLAGLVGHPGPRPPAASEIRRKKQDKRKSMKTIGRFGECCHVL